MAEGGGIDVTSLPMRGELWWTDTSVGLRPAVVLSRDAAIPVHRRALVAPCTTTIRGLRSEVVLEPNEDPVPDRSAVNLDSIESIEVTAAIERLGMLSDDRMRQICAALHIAVDC